MIDQDRLRFAAKAAGLVIAYWSSDGTLPYINCPSGAIIPWNPEHNNGDCFELAVQLEMTVNFCQFESSVENPVTQAADYPLLANDPMAAIRKMIVDAAVKIAKDE